jgi:hypothetical protein
MQTYTGQDYVNITLTGPILSIRTRRSPEVHADLHRAGLNITIRGPILSIRARRAPEVHADYIGDFI